MGESRAEAPAGVIPGKPPQTTAKKGSSNTEPTRLKLVGGIAAAAVIVAGVLYWAVSQPESGSPDDAGKTWSEPVETNITSGACPRLLKLSDGRVLLTYGRRYEPYGLYAKLSSNGRKRRGDTSWLLRAAPNSNQGYSSSVEIEPGRIFTACYAQNGDGVTGITGTFWSLPPG